MSSNNLHPEDLDRLGQALITLTKELWVVKDRVRILETVLADAGVVTPDAVDTFQPDDALQKTLETDQIQLINQILIALESKNKD
ncbi:MAG: hypothetical protein GY727_00820 [Gammaproteobacteria bacterium]|nr:hypothetical protein [Gammaproteobacteria bacterium]MCP4089987.1 hypothetical protein [Gammaproteobacteria bacterium]MCP4276318.1 hypothetical protein [Gammaproteobacteria bacterium]MCP4831313.1 hypothetical protein [Gammaproteobacteria bacterium]MCP4928796.1 hypothetical protein [Gammaproteobacteria bacterium]